MRRGQNSVKCGVRWCAITRIPYKEVVREREAARSGDREMSVAPPRGTWRSAIFQNDPMQTFLVGVHDQHVLLYFGISVLDTFVGMPAVPPLGSRIGSRPTEYDDQAVKILMVTFEENLSSIIAGRFSVDKGTDKSPCKEPRSRVPISGHSGQSTEHPARPPRRRRRSAVKVSRNPLSH